jgi:hypothetical protein
MSSPQVVRGSFSTPPAFSFRIAASAMLCAVDSRLELPVALYNSLRPARITP